MHPGQHPHRLSRWGMLGITLALAFALAIPGGSAWARDGERSSDDDVARGEHHGYERGGDHHRDGYAERHGKGHGKGHGYGHMGKNRGHGKGHGRGHVMRPHNAATHFLAMGDWLSLDHAQITRLRTLRDQFIDEHGAPLARLAAAEADLKLILHAPEIRREQAERVLQTIGQLEGPLWRAFVEHLAQVKAVLSADQKARMKARHGRSYAK